MIQPTQDAGVLISADSHVIEPHDLWMARIPAKFKDKAPRFPPQKVGAAFQAHAGGSDPKARVKEMAVDGVSGEILYPSLAMEQFGLTDAALQESCFRVYNDWLIEYCGYSLERLYGIAMIATFDIGHAIAEMRRCKDAGMRGVLVWQVPPGKYAFSTMHYDRLWAAAQEMRMPVSLHILTGEPYAPGWMPNRQWTATEGMRHSVNKKLFFVTNTLSDLISSGTMDRFPDLKFVLVENEVSWMPFVISQWDKYSARRNYAEPMKLLPSEYFQRQIYATFFNDPPTRSLFGDWGADNCMWSNDFPHPNSTWPDSRQIIARDLGRLPEAVRAKLVRENVCKLYGLKVAEPVSHETTQAPRIA